MVRFACVDLDDVPGLAGKDRGAFVSRRTFRDDLWPPQETHASWDEAALLTAVEFYHDHVSKPTEGSYHSYNDCGMHWVSFDAQLGQQEFRDEVNPILADLGEGYELTDGGEVVLRVPGGMEPLIAASPPAVRGKAYQQRIEAAKRKFRARGSSTSDRRDAVRDLADVLEYLRPEIKEVLTKKDDAALFEIANRFGLRHMDGRQFDNYDQPVWLSWIFYFYLATINAVTHLIQRHDGGVPDVPQPKEG